ncbi:ABC transporter ATP-binding protein/permease [Scatolibacter rhodanostii]|uniref:ABC transporter ATP-binding protein/permease n=1 Tax=Scatolibacter rhodanostii TaxID=2014781 RepID=UPI000C06CACC|nr:ABC transporter ATP-binding protein/permease [Scatolibacter rhodanostii]
MLKLENIIKEYEAGNTKVEALKGITLTFRESEFVSVLGQSGCGKTTLLNIIGGLDRYTSGDLFISGVSTKEYKDKDWDNYRNHSIGFVFQNYNLIPHQTVLANVELALTLGGISKDERRKRATEVLQKVGLGDQLHKKPNQMSGGQMQRVAIARALVNNPEILLADEPTGALDSETSVQIMELLKEIAKDHLVIMVTHNPELAEQYSTRIIRLLDGNLLDDSNPYTENVKKENASKKQRKKVSMSFFTALSLSLNNLMTKKGRTFLTSFAGSIGIIGIALILSLSSGMQAYISSIESDTLSSYPISIESQATDLSGLETMFQEMMGEEERTDDGKIYANDSMTSMMKSMTAQVTKNDLKQFKSYFESEDGREMKELTSSVKYGYPIDLQLFRADTSDGLLQVNPSQVLEDIGFGNASASAGAGSDMRSLFGTESWQELLGNQELLESQYDILQGQWPTSKNEVVFMVDENNKVSDMLLYSLDLLDSSELEDMMDKLKKGEKIEESDKSEVSSFTMNEILDLEFKLIQNTDRYEKVNGMWIDQSDNTIRMKEIVDNGLPIKISGIIRPKENSNLPQNTGFIGYTNELTQYIIDETNESEIVKEQKANPDTDVFTGKAFQTEEKPLTMDEINAYIATMPQEEQAQTTQMLQGMAEEEIIALFTQQMSNQNKATYDGNMKILQVADLESPSMIQLYLKDFESKELMKTEIQDYNTKQKEAGREEYMIAYTDIVGMMMSSVSSIINIITYVLIAFVAISLVVSSIMIGIITYISVLERTKEIGILRSIGASKRDISRVFNAETLIVGLVSGLLGIGTTLLLNIPINAIIQNITGIATIASLPFYGGVGLILISIFLTVLAGLFPSKVAAKKDPVIALRSE